MNIQPPKSRVTLRDIAQSVGVHPSTVSRVLNPGTRQMVTEEIAIKVELLGRLGHLRSQRRCSIFVLIPVVTDAHPPRG